MSQDPAKQSTHRDCEAASTENRTVDHDAQRVSAPEESDIPILFPASTLGEVAEFYGAQVAQRAEFLSKSGLAFEDAVKQSLREFVESTNRTIAVAMQSPLDSEPSARNWSGELRKVRNPLRR